MTGKDIKQKFAGVTSRSLDQMLDGVPYLVYGKAGTLNVHFGDVSLTTTDQRASTVLIADPADPFLYVAYKNYAAAGYVCMAHPLQHDPRHAGRPDADRRRVCGRAYRVLRSCLRGRIIPHRWLADDGERRSDREPRR